MVRRADLPDSGSTYEPDHGTDLMMRANEDNYDDAMLRARSEGACDLPPGGESNKSEPVALAGIAASSPQRCWTTSTRRGRDDRGQVPTRGVRVSGFCQFSHQPELNMPNDNS
jgi:hypothetical protein